MFFDAAWISLVLITMSWFAATNLYEPGAYWCVAYAAAAVLLGLSGPVMAGSTAGMKRDPKKFYGYIQAITSGLQISVIQCAVIFAAQGAVFPFLYTVFAKYHKEPFIAKLCAYIIGLTGAKAAAGNGVSLRFDATLAPLGFSATWEKSGAFIFILIFIGGAALLYLRKANFTRYAALFGFCAAYMLIRYSALMLVYFQYQVNNIFWERTITLVSLAPLAFVMGRYFAGDGVFIYSKSPAGLFNAISIDVYPRNNKLADRSPLTQNIGNAGNVSNAGNIAFIAFIANIAFIVSISLLAVSCAAYFGLRDPGRKKEGRVVVDEYHSDWEWTDEAYDENWFGERSGYNYYCFYEYIDKFYETSRNTAPISKELLNATDILIIKTPTQPFENAEISAIYEFVENGGGLYLIGDHTNVFGTGVNLNQIAPLFGIRFLYDCTYELTGGNLSEYDAPRFMPHPVVRDLPHFLFATSNTLETSITAEDVIIGYGLKNFQADYSQMNFFPEETNSGEIEFGAFIQSAAVTHKRGRVLAFTDSTVYSNFWMHMRGKPEMLLGALDWLNRENVFPVAPRKLALIFIGLSALTAAGSYIMMKHHGAPYNMRALLAAGLALVISLAMFFIGARIGKLPEPIRPIVNIRFENEYSEIELPIDLSGFLADMDQQLSTFYVWTQRLGFVPSLSDNLRSAVSDAAAEKSVAVISKPTKAFGDIQEILGYVNEGAIILLLDNIESGGYSNAFLNSVGMEIVNAAIQGPATYAPPEHIADETPSGAPTIITGVNPTWNASGVTGGTALMQDANGNALFSITEFGLGMIAVFSDPDLFYNNELGDVSANLTDKTALLTRLEFEIMKFLAGDAD